jgi:hypothetical protein
VTKKGPSWAPLADLLPLVGAAWMLAALFQVWLARIGHPFDLEWMEGGMLAHGWRLQRGLPIYSVPTADWTPYVYPPGYSSMLALSGSSLGYSVGRWLSVVGTMLAAASLVGLVGRHGRSWTLGLMSAAVFVLSYRASGAFMDLVRPDMVATALCGWSMVLALDGRRGTEVAGGLLLCAAFLVKHNLAAFGVPLALGLWAWRDWRTAMRFGLSAAVPALLMTAYLQWRSDGGFLTYLLSVPASHPMVWNRGLPGTQGETGGWLGVVLFVTGVGLTIAAPRKGSSVNPAVVWGAGVSFGLVACAWAVRQPAVSGVLTPSAWVMGASFFAIGSTFGAGCGAAMAGLVERKVDGRWWTAAGVFWMGAVLAMLMRAHNGGFLNVLIPWHFTVCALAGILLGRARCADGALVRAGATVTGSLAVAGQLIWLFQSTDLEPLKPNDADREAGERMLQALSENCDGPIFSPYAAWLPVQVGQPPSTHLIAIWDVNHANGPLFQHFGVFKEAMRVHHFACVVDTPPSPQQRKKGRDGGLELGVPAYYERLTQVHVSGRALIPKTGWRVQPHQIHVPKESK